MAALRNLERDETLPIDRLAAAELPPLPDEVHAAVYESLCDVAADADLREAA